MSKDVAGGWGAAGAGAFLVVGAVGAEGPVAESVACGGAGEARVPVGLAPVAMAVGAVAGPDPPESLAEGAGGDAPGAAVSEGVGIDGRAAAEALSVLPRDPDPSLEGAAPALEDPESPGVEFAESTERITMPVARIAPTAAIKITQFGPDLRFVAVACVADITAGVGSAPASGSPDVPGRPCGGGKAARIFETSALSGIVVRSSESGTPPPAGGAEYAGAGECPGSGEGAGRGSGGADERAIGAPSLAPRAKGKGEPPCAGAAIWSVSAVSVDERGSTGREARTSAMLDRDPSRAIASRNACAD